MQGNVTRIRPPLRLVAGRPLSTKQQADILWSAYSKAQTERELERADDDQAAFDQFLRAMGFWFAVALVVAVVFCAVAAALSLEPVQQVIRQVWP